jgi:hypothetical protein
MWSFFTFRNAIAAAVELVRLGADTEAKNTVRASPWRQLPREKDLTSGRRRRARVQAGSTAFDCVEDHDRREVANLVAAVTRAAVRRMAAVAQRPGVVAWPRASEPLFCALFSLCRARPHSLARVCMTRLCVLAQDATPLHLHRVTDGAGLALFRAQEQRHAAVVACVAVGRWALHALHPAHAVCPCTCVCAVHRSGCLLRHCPNSWPSSARRCRASRQNGVGARINPLE